MTVHNNSSERKFTATHLWLVALAISVFFCTLFIAMIAVYLGNVSDLLRAINDRMEIMEQRVTVAANIAAAAHAVPALPAAPEATTTTPEAAAPTVPLPGAADVVLPSAADVKKDAGDALKNAVPGSAPAAAPQPVTAPE